MLDRDILLRRRGSSKYSRSDGILWNGCHAGITWPAKCNDLMELNIICPGSFD